VAKKLSTPDLFEALGYKPHPGQLLVHRSNATRRVLACGVRWGKSTCAAMEAVAALMQPREECLGWTVAPTLDLARLVFERTAVLLQKKFKHRIKFYSQREQRIVVVNFGGGLSVLEGKTADHPTSLLGESLDFLIVDEAARMKESVWTEHLSQRLIDRRGWALFLSTPRGRDFFWKLFRRGQKGRDAAFASWSSPSWDNPYISRDLIEEERSRLSREVFDEQYGAVFIGEDLEPCDTCKGPNATAPGIVMLKDGAEMLLCPECGKAVDKDGKSLVRRIGNHQPHLMILHLESRPGGRPLPERGPRRNLLADGVTTLPPTNPPGSLG
jgi:uncharacterized C2H2 Zn-finger protein